MLPQTAIFGFLDEPDYQNFVLLNHLILLFKLNVFNSRRDKALCFNKFLRDITKVKKMEKKTTFSNENRNNQVGKKLKMTDQKIVI